MVAVRSRDAREAEGDDDTAGGEGEALSRLRWSGGPDAEGGARG